MKTDQIAVTRVLQVPGQKDIERKTTVTFRNAENTQEMLELCGGKLDEVLKLYNNGRWAEFRTKVSNALANKTPQQRAVDKLIDAYKTINPGLDENTIRQLVLSMPNMAEAVQSSLESIPAEIDETFFEKPAAAAEATPEAPAEGAQATS